MPARAHVERDERDRRPADPPLDAVLELRRRRCVLVPAASKLDRLHDVVHAAMGRYGYQVPFSAAAAEGAPGVRPLF